MAQTLSQFSNRKGRVAEQAALSQLRVLLVEDHKPFLDYVSSSLRERPSTQIVSEVSDGLVAVEQATALQPDLILLDIGLPGLNGIQAARRIRKLAPNARIIFLTQESSPEIVHEALNLGASAFVSKSRCFKDLPAAIDAVLRGEIFVSNGLDGHRM
ncbi:MAG TPA: response regulator transcription factor [Candidatus Eisenbacteria bacterium]|nr:response regulator transcription factor [Candidatus Eisenbacteria bacterium]